MVPMDIILAYINGHFLDQILSFQVVEQRYII